MALEALESNLMLARPARVFRRPKYKSRLSHDQSVDRFDTDEIPIGAADNSITVVSNPPSSSTHPPLGLQTGLDTSQISSESLEPLDATGAELSNDSDLFTDSPNCTTFRPKDTYRRIHPVSTLGELAQITCPGCHLEVASYLSECAPLDYPMNSALPTPSVFLTRWRFESGVFNTNRDSRMGNSGMLDDDIVDSFGPSRLPPIVVFKLPGARKAVVAEIADLLTPHGAEPPGMFAASLNDSRFKSVPESPLR